MKTAKIRIFWGALFVFVLCSIYVFLTLNGLSYQLAIVFTPQANITIVPDGEIPTVNFSLLTSPTPTNTSNSTINGKRSIRNGLYVQISGTGNAGLNIHNEPGINSKSLFLAIDSEVFKVIGGPVEMDGYVWWQLSAPYDQSRLGWAAENYLHVITP